MVEVLEDVFVNADSLIFRRGRIHPGTWPDEEYAEEYRHPSVYSRFLLKNYWLRRGAVKVPSGLWVIDCLSSNYFHWTAEALTRLLRAEEVAPAKQTLLLPHYYRRLEFVHFTLRAFPQVARIQWIDVRAKYRVEKLAFVPRPRRETPDGLPDLDRYRADLAEVAGRLGALAGEKAPARRIYFSRADAARRRARNEQDLVRLLRAYDFEIIQNDLSKPWEQIRSSRGAELMVGIHGAALTNLIFQPQGARLLELRHPTKHWTVYRTLAEILGLEYTSQMCTPAQTDDDVIVDLDQLRENLQALT